MAAQGPPVAHSSASARPGAPAVTPTLPPASSPEQLVGRVPGRGSCSGQAGLPEHAEAAGPSCSWPPCSVPPCSFQLPHPCGLLLVRRSSYTESPSQALHVGRLAGLRQMLRAVGSPVSPHPASALGSMLPIWLHLSSGF